jgi:Divergent InlB B-repeat domain
VTRTGFLLLAGVLAIVALAFPPASLAGGSHHGKDRHGGHGKGHGHHKGKGHGHHKGKGHGHHKGRGRGHHKGRGKGHGHGGGHGCTPPYCPSHTLKVKKKGSGSGTVTSSPAGIGCSFECWAEFEAGTKVTLTAGATPGSSFAGWSGGGCSGTGTCVITLEDDEEVTATFDDESGPPPLSVEPGGRVEVARRALVRGGKARLKLTCFDDPCNGTLRLTARGKKKKAVLIGGAAFSLEAGASATIKVRLSRAARKALAKRRILLAKVSGTGVTTSPVILKLAKKKKR